MERLPSLKQGSQLGLGLVEDKLIGLLSYKDSNHKSSELSNYLKSLKNCEEKRTTIEYLESLHIKIVEKNETASHVPSHSSSKRAFSNQGDLKKNSFSILPVSKDYEVTFPVIQDSQDIGSGDSVVVKSSSLTVLSSNTCEKSGVDKSLLLNSEKKDTNISPQKVDLLEGLKVEKPSDDSALYLPDFNDKEQTGSLSLLCSSQSETALESLLQNKKSAVLRPSTGKRRGETNKNYRNRVAREQERKLLNRSSYSTKNRPAFFVPGGRSDLESKFSGSPTKNKVFAKGKVFKPKDATRELNQTINMFEKIK